MILLIASVSIITACFCASEATVSLMDVNRSTHDYVLVENNSKTDGIDSFHCQENG